MHNLYSRFCLSCCANSVASREVHPGLATSSLTTVVLPSSVTTLSDMAGLEDRRMETTHGRRRSETKALYRECDIRHWNHTRRLEKWHSTNRTARSSSAGFVSMQSMYCSLTSMIAPTGHSTGETVHISLPSEIFFLK